MTDGTTASGGHPRDDTVWSPTLRQALGNVPAAGAQSWLGTPGCRLDLGKLVRRLPFV